MIHLPQFIDRNTALQILTSEASLSSDLLTALRNELINDPAGRGYSGKTPAEIVTLLTEPYTISNPAQQTTVDRTEWDRSDLYNLLLQSAAPDGQTPLMIYIDAVAKSNPDPVKQIVAQQALILLNSPLSTINLLNPRVKQGIDALYGYGIISQTTYLEIVQHLDPTYQSTLEQSPRLGVIGLGTGQYITVKDVEEALA